MRHPGLIVYLVAIFMVSSVASQEIAVPVDLQYSLFVKILSYNRALMTKNDDSITIGIVYQSRYSASRNAKDEFVESIVNSPSDRIQGRQIKYIEIDIMNEDLKEIVASNLIDVLYLTPVRAYNIDTVVEVCRSAGILSLSSVPEYCERGLSVSIDQHGEKPEIIINLEASRLEGADFSSQLLKLATVL